MRDEVFDARIEKSIARVTAGPRIDVFSRESREGFAQFGNEPAKFDHELSG